MLVRQARPFLPLMFMASDPQTPSRQERRNEMLGSTALSFISASSNMRSLPFQLHLNGLHVGLGVLVGVVAIDLECTFLHLFTPLSERSHFQGNRIDRERLHLHGFITQAVAFAVPQACVCASLYRCGRSGVPVYRRSRPPSARPGFRAAPRPKRWWLARPRSGFQLRVLRYARY